MHTHTHTSFSALILHYTHTHTHTLTLTPPKKKQTHTHTQPHTSMDIAVFYGGKDTVIDIDALKKVLPGCVLWHEEPEYEHLDVIWADSALEKVFPPLVKLLKEY